MPRTARDKDLALQLSTGITAAAGLLYLAYSYNIHNKLWRRLKGTPKIGPRCFDSKSTPPSLTEFKALTQQNVQPEDYALALNVQNNVVIYDCNSFDLPNMQKIDIELLQSEICHILIRGPGALVLKNFFSEPTTIDAANQAYEAIIAQELSTNGGKKGDHFAPASANSRIWNSFSKHCIQDPESFARYFSNPWFKVVCEAYLGPAYRLTSQVNIVHPGGKAQMPHRDYHLGFQTDEDVVKWPKQVHVMSSYLTLQGAVAHTDMPVESGPTRLLPWSHLFEEGFRAYRSPEFIKYFEENYVCLPLEKGDALFFNPALFHAAGENQTADFSRSANLIQVSSGFGKPMESIDTLPLIQATYDFLLAKYTTEGMSVEVDAFVRAVAEGYPFPTNLDCRPPAPGGQAPESEQDILRRGLSEGWDKGRTMRELTDMRQASSASGRVE